MMISTMTTIYRCLTQCGLRTPHRWQALQWNVCHSQLPPALPLSLLPLAWQLKRTLQKPQMVTGPGIRKLRHFYFHPRQSSPFSSIARRYGRLPRDGHEDVRPPPHSAPYSFEERFHWQRHSQRIRSARSDSDENWVETQSLYVPGLALTRATASDASVGVSPANVAALTDPTEISVPRRHRYVNPDTVISLLLRILQYPCIVRPYGRLRGNGLQDPGSPSFPAPAPARPLPAPTVLSGHGIADRSENGALPAPNAQVEAYDPSAAGFGDYRTLPPYTFVPTVPDRLPRPYAPFPVRTRSTLVHREPRAPPTAAVATVPADTSTGVFRLQQAARASSPYPDLHDLPDYEDTPSPRHATMLAPAAEATTDEAPSRFESSAPTDGAVIEAMHSALTTGSTRDMQARQERRVQAERLRLQDDLFGLSNPDASVSPVDVDLGRLWWDSPTMLSGRAARR
jgi:hypothetical protein